MSRQASVSPLPETIILDTIVVRTGGHGIIPAARRLEKLHVLHSSTKGNCGVEETSKLESFFSEVIRGINRVVTQIQRTIQVPTDQ